MMRERLSEFPDTLGAIEGMLEVAGLVNHGQLFYVVTANQIEEVLVFAGETVKNNVLAGVFVFCVAAVIALEHGVVVRVSINALEVVVATKHSHTTYLLKKLKQ